MQLFNGILLIAYCVDSFVLLILGVIFIIYYMNIIFLSTVTQDPFHCAILRM